MVPCKKSSDSLKAVLLSARTPSNSGSKHGSSGLTWYSLKSGEPTSAISPPGNFFPVKLALALGLIKIFFSLLTVSLGTVAIVMKASISSVGAGLWVGIIIGVSGFLGICAARRAYVHVYVVSFMSVSILSLASSGILVVLSAAAWARDNQVPQIYLYDKETQSEIDLFGAILINRPSIVVSGILVVLGVLDILTSLACVSISAREACGSGSGAMGVFSLHDGTDKKERLYRWLGQQKTLFPGSSTTPPKHVNTVSQFVHLNPSRETSERKESSVTITQGSDLYVPRKIVPIKGCHNAQRYPKVNSEDGRPKRKSNISDSSKTSSGYSSDKKSSVVFLQPQINNDLKEPVLVRQKIKSSIPQRNRQPMSLPPVLQSHDKIALKACNPRNHASRPIPVQYYGQNPIFKICHDNPYRQQRGFQSLPYSNYQCFTQQPVTYYPSKVPVQFSQVEKSQRTKREENRQRNVKKKEKEKIQRRKLRREKKNEKEKEPMTDEQIEETYTGLDREIAEGFISFSMEPSASQRKTSRSTSDVEDSL